MGMASLPHLDKDFAGLINVSMQVSSLNRGIPAIKLLALLSSFLLVGGPRLQIEEHLFSG